MTRATDPTNRIADSDQTDPAVSPLPALSDTTEERVDNSNTCSVPSTSSEAEVYDMANQRDMLIGQRTHALIAAHARQGVVPQPRQIWVAATRLYAKSPMPQNGAARQRTACAAGVYWKVFHHHDWSFVGAETPLGTGRVDLIWTTAEGLIVVDEVKMAGFADVVDDAATLAQVERYRVAAVALFGDRFAGVRILPLAAPGRALWCAPDGTRVPLESVSAFATRRTAA